MMRKPVGECDGLRVIRCGLMALAILLVPNCRPASSLEMTPELRKVVDGARAEGKLTVESPPSLMGGGDAVKEAADWIDTYRHIWEERFDRLDDYLRELQRRQTHSSEEQQSSDDQQ